MPGDDMDNFKGGVTGGSILESMLRDRRQDWSAPGIVNKDEEGKMTCVSIVSDDVRLDAGNEVGTHF